MGFSKDKANRFLNQLYNIFQTTNNMDTVIGDTPSPNHYPSTEAVKNYIDEVLNQ